MKTVKYVAVYLLIIQLAVAYLFPFGWLYQSRMDYEIVKNNPGADTDAIVTALKRTIDQQHLQDYVIMLGDSVGYSGPGGPDQTVNHDIERLSQAEGKPLKVFNLSMPAMQVGDIYVMLLKLQEHGIKTDRLVINVIYPGFIARTPMPSIVFWLTDDLKRLDPEAYSRWQDHLQANGRVKTGEVVQTAVREGIGSKISLIYYRDFLKDKLFQTLGIGKKNEVYDTRPWYEKAGLKDVMQTWEYQNYFSPQPFVMTDANPQIYFLERLFAKTQGSQVLVYLSPVNQELMDNYVRNPGYQENVRRIDQWMATQPVTYVNLEKAMNQRYFADHLHMTPEGYQQLAAMLWKKLESLATSQN